MASPWPTAGSVDTSSLDQDSDLMNNARVQLQSMVNDVNAMLDSRGAALGSVPTEFATNRILRLNASVGDFASANRTTNQTLGAAPANAIMSFTGDLSNTTGFTNLGGQPTRITIPSKTPSINAVEVHAGVQVDPTGPNADSLCKITASIHLNGAPELPIVSSGQNDVLITGTGWQVSNVSADKVTIYMSTPTIYVSANDYFELEVNNTGSQGATNFRGFLSVYVVS